MTYSIMALYFDGGLFLHIPKTAGVSVRQILKSKFLINFELGAQHSHFPDLFEFHDVEFYRKLYVFTFVRHPLSWYQSRWSFRMKYGWQMSHPLDYYCASNDFGVFLYNCHKHFPHGWLSAEYRNYIEYRRELVKYVGKYESLEKDMASILNQFGLVFNTIKRLNDSDISGKSSKELAVYTNSTRDLVLNMEQDAISKYYE